MNKLLSLLFVCLICTLSNAQKLAEFPPYEQVVNQFLTTTTVCKMETRGLQKITFEKRKDGYWVGMSIYSQENLEYEIKDKFLFWSPKKGFQKVSLDGGTPNTPLLSVDLLRQAPNPIANQDKFNIHPFYGYLNWEDDVIQFYTKKEKKGALSAMEYYSIGRAYSSKCNTYILEEGKKITSLRKDSINLVINTYSEWQDKAILNFEKSYKKDANLETIVGRIYNKYCNEFMHKYNNLSLYANQETALKAIEGKELYSETTLAFAKNLLNNCPPNAILFCYGDNDTWPLMYLQLVQNYRTDVLLVNTSLIAIDYYIDLIQNFSINKSSIDLGIPRNLYAGKNSNFILIDPLPEKKAITVNHLFALLNDFIHTLFFRNPKIHSTNIILSGPGDHTIELETKGDYLFKGDLISILILEQNKGKRAICYTPTFGLGQSAAVTRAGIYKYLHQTGYGYQFKYTITTGNPMTNVDAIENYQLLKEQIAWPKIEKIHSEDLYNFKGYKATTLVSINKLIEMKEEEKALELTDGFFAAFSPEVAILTPNEVTQFVDVYFKLKKQKQAKALIQSYFEGLLPKTQLTRDESQSVLYINRMMDKYNIITFDKTLKKLLNKPVK